MKRDNFFAVNPFSHFADVLVPLPVQGYFTYGIPGEWMPGIREGARVVVRFGKKKIYTALVRNIHSAPPKGYEAKPILSLLDEKPLVTGNSFRFWEWMASYYMCSEGEVMNAALPSALKLESESEIVLNPGAGIDQMILGEKEELVVEALRNRRTLQLTEVARLLNQQKIIPLVNTMLERGIILVKEELTGKYVPKKEVFVRLSPAFAEDESRFRKLFDQLEKRAKKQLELLMAYFVLSGREEGESREVSRTRLLKASGASAAALEGLVRKGVFGIAEKVVSRIAPAQAQASPDSIELTGFQQAAFDQIHNAFREKEVVLLHGVTSSGKTELYIKLIHETLQQGKQVLYLLPEIALTAQIINRLKRYFGDRVGVYHSRFNEQERVEIWNRVLPTGDGKSFDIILGARSAVFLPFTDLGLVIVDEEHDSSFKQYDPSPRYNGRDAALYLAHLHSAKTVLGSATPSLESYYQAEQGKYGLVEMKERYGNLELPEIRVVDVRQEIRWKKMRSHFTSVLFRHLEEALKKGEQSILFQNRRGFSLRLECETCHWMPECRNCDVTLVYHKQSDHLRCHYCGYTANVPHLCPSCGGTSLKMIGFGTEKVEEDLAILFPEARISRMDLDTTRTRYSYHRILDDFEQRKIDILVGTQMVTKGLDFDNVSTVGILNADNMLSFPDFRSAERGFQLMAQVSGRSGRKNKQGRVIVQTFNPGHPVIRDVVNHDYLSLYREQMADRKKFRYPPYYRLIRIEVKHKDNALLQKAAGDLAARLRIPFGSRVLGPEYPLVPRIKNLYIRQILVKLERQSSPVVEKEKITEQIEEFYRQMEFKPVRMVIDVDPQ